MHERQTPTHIQKYIHIYTPVPLIYFHFRQKLAFQRLFVNCIYNSVSIAASIFKNSRHML